MDELQKTKKRSRLMTEIVLVLCCKLAVIFAIWFFFFGPDKRMEQTPESVATGLLDRTTVQESAQHNSTQ